jgi:hypothetical protein
MNLWQENELCYVGLTVFSIYLLQRLQFLLGGGCQIKIENMLESWRG